MKVLETTTNWLTYYSWQNEEILKEQEISDDEWKGRSLREQTEWWLNE